MQSLARASELTEATGADAWQPFIHEGRADVAAVSGDDDMRERKLCEAQRLFTDLDCPIRVEQITRRLAT
jgi:hypothetical protein